METVIFIENDKIFFTGNFRGHIKTIKGEIGEIVTCKWSHFLKDGKMQYKTYMKIQNEEINSF